MSKHSTHSHIADPDMSLRDVASVVFLVVLPTLVCGAYFRFVWTGDWSWDECAPPWWTRMFGDEEVWRGLALRCGPSACLALISGAIAYQWLPGLVGAVSACISLGLNVVVWSIYYSNRPRFW